MAKTYHEKINERRKRGDRKGFIGTHINQKPPISQRKIKTPCLKDCVNCPRNNFCATLPYI